MGHLELASASSVKAQLAAFGESVSYDQLAAGIPVVFTAIVERMPEELLEMNALASETGLKVKRVIFALNIPTDTTLANITITKNSDEVSFKEDLADAANTVFTVITDPKADGGFRRVLVTA